MAARPKPCHPPNRHSPPPPRLLCRIWWLDDLLAGHPFRTAMLPFGRASGLAQSTRGLTNDVSSAFFLTSDTSTAFSPPSEVFCHYRMLLAASIHCFCLSKYKAYKFPPDSAWRDKPANCLASKSPSELTHLPHETASQKKAQSICLRFLFLGLDDSKKVPGLVVGTAARPGPSSTE